MSGATHLEQISALVEKAREGGAVRVSVKVTPETSYNSSYRGDYSIVADVEYPGAPQQVAS